VEYIFSACVESAIDLRTKRTISKHTTRGDGTYASSASATVAIYPGTRCDVFTRGRTYPTPSDDQSQRVLSGNTIYYSASEPVNTDGFVQ